MCSFVYTKTGFVAIRFCFVDLLNGRVDHIWKTEVCSTIWHKTIWWLEQMTITLALSSLSLEDFLVYGFSVWAFHFPEEVTYKTLLYLFALQLPSFKWSSGFAIPQTYKFIQYFLEFFYWCSTHVYKHLMCFTFVFRKYAMEIAFTNEMLSSLWILWGMSHRSTLKNIDFVYMLLEILASFIRIYVVFGSSAELYIYIFSK